MKPWCRFAMVLMSLAVSASLAFAQESIQYGSLGGLVSRAAGGPIQGAQVAARQTDTNIVTKAESDKDGRFHFPYLRVGPYEVTVHQQGFKSFTQTVTLTAGGAIDLTIALEAGVETSVTVSGTAPVLETARTQIAGTISQNEIKSLPLNGRNFLDLALLIPGVSPTNVGGGTQLFPETSAVPGVGLSVSSQRNLSNSFIVDGLSSNDDAAALVGMPYGVDAVDQFQVVTSGGQAELGRALGGYVSIVTKSGTNTMQGSFYEYARNSRFNAPNALTGQTLPMNQNQYGFSFGGPLVKNRTFYFTNVEERRLNQSGLVTITPDNIAAINARLTAV